MSIDITSGPGSGDGAEARLREIEARVNAATPEPWWHEQERYTSPPLQDKVRAGSPGDNKPFPLAYLYHERRGGDGRFIAHAREDVPWLLARVASLARRLAAAERIVHLFNAAPSEAMTKQWMLDMSEAQQSWKALADAGGTQPRDGQGAEDKMNDSYTIEVDGAKVTFRRHGPGAYVSDEGVMVEMARARGWRVTRLPPARNPQEAEAVTAAIKAAAQLVILLNGENA